MHRRCGTIEVAHRTGATRIGMFIRFTILATDPDTRKEAGVLVAAHLLRDNGDLSVEQHHELRLCLKWFNEHLNIPPTYRDSGNNKRALSWYKPEAKKPIERMWR